MRYRLAVGVIVAVLAGCSTVTQMEATGGSRSDGIVKLSFEYGAFDKIDIDKEAALQTARQRCGVWGYTDADAFGGVTRECQAHSMYGCTHWFVTREYQCTMGGGGAPALTQASVPGPLMAPPAMSVSANGPRRVHANTASGYCLDITGSYIGTGAENSPVVSAAMPRCDQLSAGK